CYSVRLASLVGISAKAYKATAFDGSSAIIPKSQVKGTDYDVQKSEAYWIAAWFLEKEDVHLQCSYKKEAWFDENGNMLPTYHIEKHTPEKKNPLQSNQIDELAR
ncbi:MAG: hypothetical protein WCJ03_03100, partial [Bacteroidales bacterium]